jgi:hypothetical protein
MKYYKSIILFTLIVLFISCSEDFFDKKPIARASSLTYYSTFNALDATVTAAYGELCAREVFDKDYYLAVGSIPADDVECGGESTNDYPMAQHYDQFNYLLNDATPLEEIWRYCYKGLRFANTALDILPTIKEVDPAVSDELIARRTGEMKFIRALYHFMLVQVFGGVPVADKPIQPADFSKPRNTIKEVFTFIEQDLKDAIGVLPPKKALGSEIGRASKEAAQSLLCKMLLYESGYAKNYPGDERFTGCLQRWSEALEYGDAVIASIDNVFLGLVNEDGSGAYTSSWRTDMRANDGFRWMFTVDGDNCMESIFEIQNVNDGLGYGITRGNVLSVYQTVRYYTTTQGESGSYGGWSFNCPSRYLIDAFGNKDSRESNLHSSPGNETNDPRFATTVGREGDTILLVDGSDRYVLMSFSNLPTGTIGRKFECGYDEYWIDGTFTQGPYNVRLIRLADVMLLAAEAAVETGDANKALNYVNRVRTRARNCGNTGFPQNLTACSFEDIVHERRLELACEPHRFFDLVRWGLTDEFITGTVLDAYPGATVTFEAGKHEFWPIPITEIQLSQGGLVNYPAWQ